MKQWPLSPRKGKPQHRQIHVWDIETKPVDIDGVTYLRPFLLGYMGTAYIPFRGPTCVADFIDYLFDSLEHESVVWAHNGGGFDHQFVVYALDGDKRYQIVPVLSGSSTILMMVTRLSDDHTILFMDSMRTINMPLAKIGKVMFHGSLDKMKLDLNTPEDDPRWLEYNATDCLVLHTALSSVQIAINALGGEMGLTGGATAMDIFQRRYLKMDIWPLRSGSDEAFVLSTYVGGRTEPADLRIRENVDTYDANSLYPYACTFPLPTKLKKAISNNSPLIVEYVKAALADDSLIGFVECTVDVPEVHMGPLPLKYTGKLIFPIGRFTGRWSTADLANLYRCGGRIVSATRALFFEGKEIAADMMRELYAARNTKDQSKEASALALSAKLAINSWYGKTGQRPERQSLIMRPSVGWLEKKKGKGEYWVPHGDGKMWTHNRVKRQPHMLPQIASHTTALARRHHFKFLNERTINCDTDSTTTDEKFESSTELGGFKLEQHWAWYQVVLPKTYHGGLDNGDIITKAKGFGGWNKEEYENGVVSHLIDGGKVRVAGPTKLKGLLRTETMEPREKVQYKRLRSTYDKRIVNEDGTTKPIRLAA